MKPASNLAGLIGRYFTERLMCQRNVSANTIASYRDTFRLLFTFAQAQLRKSPSDLALGDLDAPFIGAFLNDLETKRSASAKTRNLRLTAIRSFFRFVSFEEPAHGALIQRVLAIPSKRHDKRQVYFLSRPEIEAILATPDRTTWLGRRDHTFAADRGPDRIAPLRAHQPRQGCRPPRRRRSCAVCRQGTERTDHPADRARPGVRCGHGSRSRYEREQLLCSPMCTVVDSAPTASSRYWRSMCRSPARAVRR